MTGLILAAGIGSRLKPWTDEHPKALIPLCGKPVIGYVIEKFLTLGLQRIIINVHHFAGQVEEYVRTTYPHTPIMFSDERARLLDTGGAIRKVLSDVDDKLLVHNADIYSDFDLRQMVEAHERSNADVTLLVENRPTMRYFLFEGDLLRGWTNVKTGEVKNCCALECRPLAFGGVHILNLKALNAVRMYAEAEKPFSVTDFYIDKCNELKIRAFERPCKSLWFDVGSVEKWKQAQEVIENEKDTNT